MTKQHSHTDIIQVQHVTIVSEQSFTALRTKLETLIPPIDHSIFTLLRDGDDAHALEAIEACPPLSIFATQDHGALLRLFGHNDEAIQYMIGNPLTASKMTRHQLGAALYAPVRVLLRSDASGGAAFEYDRPLSVFGQFGDSDVQAVAHALDTTLHDVLTTAAN